MIAELLSPRQSSFGNTRTIVAYQNGMFNAPKKTITIRSAALTLQMLMAKASDLLNVSARKVFNYDGRELKDLSLVADGDVLFFSQGEKFVTPVTPNDPTSSATVVKNFKLLKRLGEGSFGQVYYAKNTISQKEAALKFIIKKFTQSFADSVFSEIHCLESLNHRHVIELYSVINAPEYIVLVMEYAKGGDLKTYIDERTSLDEKVCCRMFRQIMGAMRYCHKQRIVHHDLKLQNILLMEKVDPNDIDNVCIKVADFGLSQMQKPRGETDFRGGSLAYLAPEVFAGEKTDGAARDVWSCGIVLYALLTGKLPWGQCSSKEMKQKIVGYNGGLESFSVVFGQGLKKAIDAFGNADSTEKICEDKKGVKSLLFRLLRPNPADRPSSTATLSHGWLEKFLLHTRANGKSPSSPKPWAARVEGRETGSSLSDSTIASEPSPGRNKSVYALANFDLTKDEIPPMKMTSEANKQGAKVVHVVGSKSKNSAAGTSMLAQRRRLSLKSIETVNDTHDRTQISSAIHTKQTSAFQSPVQSVPRQHGSAKRLHRCSSLPNVSASTHKLEAQVLKWEEGSSGRRPSCSSPYILGGRRMPNVSSPLSPTVRRKSPKDHA